MKKILGFLLLLLAGWNAGAQIPCLPGTLSTGVVAFYPFGLGSLNDVSGGGHTLINSGAIPIADRFGSPNCAYHFNSSTGDFMQIPGGGSTFVDGITYAPFSVSLWYQPTGPRGAGVYELLLGRGPTSGLHCPDTWGEWSIGLYDCRWAVVGHDYNEVWQTPTGPCLSPTGSWHHLAYVWDGVNRNLYVDGLLYSTVGGPCGPGTANLGDLMLGVGYTGDLDDIVIYNRALTPGEVATLRRLGSCCETGVTQGPCKILTGSLTTGVMAFWPFSSGSLTDMSGAGHNLSNSSLAHPTADRFGNPKCAYRFDKINVTDELFIPYGVGSTTFVDGITHAPFSISLWYQPIGPRSPGDYELLIGRGPSIGGLHCPDTWNEWSIGLYDCRYAVTGHDYYAVWETPGSSPCLSSTGSWHHLAYIWDGISRSLYVDGTLYATASGPCGPGTADAGDLTLGADYTGDLDDVVLYNRALTPTEVTDLMKIKESCCDTPVHDTCTTLTGSLGTGVIAFYPFGLGSLSDLSGGGHNLVNPTSAYPTVDRAGNPTCAYHFDNSMGDFLQVAAGGSSFTDNLTTAPFSISLWYQPIGPRSAGAYELLLGRGPSGGLHCPDTWGEWSVGLYDCRYAVVGHDNYAVWETPGSSPCLSSTGSWHHLAYVYDGITRNLYVDGTLYSSASGPCGPGTFNLGDLMLGVDYTGDLDDIVIYNRNLSAAEVTALSRLPASCCDGSTSFAKGGHAANPTKAVTKKATTVRVFPNPSDGEVFVSAGTAVIQKVIVYSSTGQVVGTYTYDSADVSMKLGNLAPGMYQLRVTTDEGTTMHKLIKK